jgi:hypothetical protein
MAPYLDPTESMGEFLRLRPVVPRALAMSLGTKQAITPGQRMYPDNSLADLALWAHCQAFRTDGSNASPPGLEHSHAARLLSPRLNWGSTTQLSEGVPRTSLDSPVIHAWLYYEQAEKDSSKQVVEVLLVGSGASPVREQVEASALACFLAVEPNPNNLFLNGLIHILVGDTSGEEAPAPAGGFLRTILAPLGFSNAPVRAAIEVPADSQQAMNDLHSELLRLEKSTALVRVHEVPLPQLRSFRIKVEELARTSMRDSTPSILVGSDKSDEVVSARPVVRLVPKRRSPLLPLLRLRLSPDLLASPLYVKIVDLYRAALVEPILADLDRRHQFFEDELEEHQSNYRWYQGLSEKERNKLPDVVANIELDYEFAQTRYLLEPSRIPAHRYYTSEMQSMSEKERAWISKIDHLQKRMKDFVNHTEKPLHCLIGARLFDSALRDLPISDNQEIEAAFQQWKGAIQPMLWLEFRAYLESEGIALEDGCTTHTVFNLQTDSDAREIGIVAWTLLDSRESVLVLDGARKVQVVVHPSDYAEQREQPVSAAEAISLYKKAKEAAEAGAGAQATRDLLLQGMRNDPKVLLENIAAEWLDSFSSVENPLEGITKSAVRKEFGLFAAFTALRWCNEQCYFSAEGVLAKALSENEPPNALDAAALMMSAYVKIAQNGYPMKTLSEILDRRKVDPELNDAAALLLRAQSLCPDVVEVFVRHHSLMSPRSFVSDPSLRLTAEEDAALAILAAIECANVCFAVDYAMSLLNQNRESQRNCFVKVMPALERCVGLEYSAPPALTDHLIEVLTGLKRSAKGA